MQRILVVNDEPVIRELISEIVFNLGYEVLSVGNGKKAINFFQNGGEASLVITDRRMPEMLGEELTSWVTRNRKIPVIMVTGDDLEVVGPVAHAAGASEVLGKGHLTIELPAAIKSVIGPPGMLLA